MTSFPTPVFRTVLAVAATLALMATVGDARAEETEGAAPSPSAYHLFTSWFAGKSRVDVEATLDGSDLQPQAEGAAPSSFTARASALVSDALGLIGIGYRLGGSSPSAGFDCSGMVRYVYQNALGLSLPRRAEEISHVGVKIALNELKPGDLVFYKTLKKTFSHVGIYLGNNRFIHAPSAGGAVRIDDMTQSYWTARFNGARRIEG